MEKGIWRYSKIMLYRRWQTCIQVKETHNFQVMQYGYSRMVHQYITKSINHIRTSLGSKRLSGIATKFTKSYYLLFLKNDIHQVLTREKIKYKIGLFMKLFFIVPVILANVNLPLELSTWKESNGNPPGASRLNL
ncbi:hypothetical protein NQ318_004680 [Aromia moschata]|uniref:Uncharacterized protein n=1 Tax=Aromia moschata TaxID=1265417 RepID=A0AAV8Y8A4_9CUCU|nr:hypothetical protein NQ318_004680 [Aromia moschata]